MCKSFNVPKLSVSVWFNYQSNCKGRHSGILMSSDVRKRKWHKLCVRLFTINFFQKFNADNAVVYGPKKKEKHHNF